MDIEHNDVSERERRLDEVLGSYFEALAAGGAPERQELLARHPELASDLTDFFADQEAVDRWTASLRPAGWRRGPRCSASATRPRRPPGWTTRTSSPSTRLARSRAGPSSA